MSPLKLLEDPSTSGSQTNDSDEATVDAVDRQESNAKPWLQKSNELTEFISHTNGNVSCTVDGQQDTTSEEVSQDGTEQVLGTLFKITTTFKNLFK